MLIHDERNMINNYKYDHSFILDYYIKNIYK